MSDVGNKNEVGPEKDAESGGNDNKVGEKATEAGTKRPRGPEDCLNWESEEEEFTPFTQERIFTPVSDHGRKVFAKKSVVKGIAKNSASKKPRLKSGRKKTSGKLIRNLFGKLWFYF
jgi:hypothetical protein